MLTMCAMVQLTEAKKAIIRRHLLNLVVSTHSAFALVDYEDFKALFRFVVPGFTLPSARTLRRDLDRIYSLSVAQIKSIIEVT